MISHEPKNRTLAVCDPADKIPWTGANQCNCSEGQPGTAAAELQPEAPMANYVGRSRVYLPYYRYKTPMDAYPVSVLAGDNLSFPRKGACAEAAGLGDDACTWKRLPSARMIYGADLMQHGWDTTAVRSQGSIVKELNVTYANMAVFDRAFEALEGWVTPRCCGC